MARLLFVAVLALHPAAIDLAKEFKPYSASLCGHLVVLFCVLRYLATQRARDLALALVAALVANLFAQDLVMAYPGTFLVLGWDTFTRQRGRLPWVVAGALALVVALLAQYWFIWRHLVASEEASYWGQKYNVFYVEDTEQSHLAWWLGRYGELAAFPALRHKYWTAPWVSEHGLKQIASVETVIWWLIYAAGLVTVFVRRRFREATLLLMPFATITLMNTVGRWPFGPFRTNLFLLVYLAATASMAFDWPLPARLRSLAIAPAALLVLLPLCAFDRDWNARKRALCADSDMARVVRFLVANEPEGPRKRRHRTLLFLSGRVCSTYEYYSSVHPRTSERFHQALRQTFEVRCAKTPEKLQAALAEEMPAEGHAWLVTDLVSTGELAHIRRALRKKIRFETRFSAPPHELDELTPVK